MNWSQYTGSQPTENVLRMFCQGSLNVMNKRSTRNIYRMFVRSYLVFNNVLKTLAQKHYILGVARYTDVTVRYVPRFGGHGSIRFRYNMKKKNLLCSFHLFWTDSSANKKKSRLDVKILHIITYYIYTIYFVFIVSVHK